MKEHERRVFIEQVRISYGQTLTAVVGGTLGALLFVWMFWSVSDHAVLIGWLICSQTVVFARSILYLKFKRRENDSAIERWGRLFYLFTFSQGSVWGAAWLIFLPVEDPIYNLVLAVWAIGMSGAAVSAYVVHLPSLMSFFIPVLVPGIVQLMIIGGTLHVALALAICVYVVVVLRALLPVHRSVVDAIGLNFVLEDEIAERKRVEAQLREISLQDGLTGLANRRHFDNVLEVELQRAQRSSRPLSLVLIDIDDFKPFNDTYGHLKGDECLRRISRLIRETVKRTGDLVARYGGDELALILPDTDAEDALRIADGVREAVAAMAIPHAASAIEGCQLVTISAGIATMVPGRYSVPSDLIQVADDALYGAKRKGRNQTEA